MLPNNIAVVSWVENTYDPIVGLKPGSKKCEMKVRNIVDVIQNKSAIQNNIPVKSKVSSLNKNNQEMKLQINITNVQSCNDEGQKELDKTDKIKEKKKEKRKSYENILVLLKILAFVLFIILLIFVIYILQRALNDYTAKNKVKKFFFFLE